MQYLKKLINPFVGPAHSICTASIPGNGPKASEIVLDICNTLEQNSISLPDISTVAFSNFSEKDGWGYDFDGESISIILSHN